MEGGVNMWGVPNNFPEIQKYVLQRKTTINRSNVFPNVVRKQENPHKSLTPVIHHPLNHAAVHKKETYPEKKTLGNRGLRNTKSGVGYLTQFLFCCWVPRPTNVCVKTILLRRRRRVGKRAFRISDQRLENSFRRCIARQRLA